MKLNANTYQDGVANLNSSTKVANSIVLCALGSYNGSGSTNLIHPNGQTATSNGNAGKATTVYRNNVNGVSFTNCSFTESGDGYCAIRVYTVV